jgi:hypothetical protein
MAGHWKSRLEDVPNRTRYLSSNGKMIVRRTNLDLTKK